VAIGLMTLPPSVQGGRSNQEGLGCLAVVFGFAEGKGLANDNYGSDNHKDEEHSSDEHDIPSFEFSTDAIMSAKIVPQVSCLLTVV